MEEKCWIVWYIYIYIIYIYIYIYIYICIKSTDFHMKKRVNFCVKNRLEINQRVGATFKISFSFF